MRRAARSTYASWANIWTVGARLGHGETLDEGHLVRYLG